MSPSTNGSSQDPRQLRALFDRAGELSRVHEVGSVFVGVAGREGDRIVRDFLDFLEAELRVEDAVFRLLRERAVVLLTDVDREQAGQVMERLQADFAGHVATAEPMKLAFGYHPVGPGGDPTAKDVLPALFAERPPN